MQDSPLVSIVIPVHNGERYIKESMMVFYQTYEY